MFKCLSKIKHVPNALERLRNFTGNILISLKYRSDFISTLANNETCKAVGEPLFHLDIFRQN